MAYYYEKVPLLGNSTYLVREHVVDQFDYPPHYHPEFELIYISYGKGLRFVGNNISEFSDGDLVLIGPMVPHYRHNKQLGSELSKARQILLQFHPTFLGNEFSMRMEAEKINSLLKNAGHGIRFYGKNARKAGQLLEQLLLVKDKFEGLILFLQILHILSSSNKYNLLSAETFNVQVKNDEDNRIELIYNFLTNNFTENITLKTLSRKFGMKESALSHFIRKRTGKNFIDILIDLRLNHACRLLVETDQAITRICFDCGFNNLSNFNRIFKKIKLTTPLNYRNTFKHPI